jgi:type II secretion system protein N
MEGEKVCYYQNMIDKKILIRRLSFAAYFAAVFFIFLLFLFPFDRIKTKIESEVRLRTPVELSVSRISPRFFNRFALIDVVVSDKTGRVLFKSPSVHTKVSLFGLLRGLLSVDLKSAVYGGELSVKARQGSILQSLVVDAAGLDISAYPLLKDLGLQVSGRLGGNFDMRGDAGKGRFLFKNLAWRGLNVKGFPLPDLDFEQAWVEAELKGDRLLVKKMEMEGKELKLLTSGDMVLRERGSLNLVVKLKPSERLAREYAGVVSLLKNRDADGFYQFTLGGTLDMPMPRL